VKRLSGFISIILVVIFWGVSFVSISIMLEVVHPVVLGFLRYVLAVIFVLILALSKRMDFRITKSDFLIFFLAALIGIFLYSSLENTALLFISSSAGAIFASLTPMFAIVGNRMIFKESIRSRDLGFIAISMVGVGLVVSSDLSVEWSWYAMLGYGLMVLSIVSWTAYNLFTKKVTLKYDSLKVTTIQSVIVLFIFLPSLFIAPVDFASFETKHWIHLVFLGLICSGVAYYLYVHSVDTLGLTIPNVFINFIPVVTIITNAILFQTTIHWIQIIGGVMIVISMSLLTLDSVKHNVEKSPTK
jgi:drug/metabolite transporter (DMT)-like permease